MLATLLRDLRFGARTLLKDRAFTAIALGSLALGIGGSAAMYSVIHAVILDPFIYKDVDRLVSIGVIAPDNRNYGGYYTVDQFLDLAAPNRVFEGVIASTVSDVVWTGAGDPLRLRGNHCTPNTFDIMGVPPLIGRAPAAGEAGEAAVLGYKFWMRQFNGDPGVIGQKLHLNDKVRTVTGVMPPRFMWRGADVYLPVEFHRGEITEGVQFVHALARLKPGVSIEQANGMVRPVLQSLVERAPQLFPKGWRADLQTFALAFPSGIKDALWILFAAVGLLLTIACVNVSNLLLARAAARRREIAIRASMGASRWRLMRQLLAESLVLGLSGGLLGVVAAYGAVRGIIAMVPPFTIPDEAHISVNAPVLWFTLAVSLGAALLFGLAPALHVSTGDIATPLKDAGRANAGSRGQRLLRGVLVVGEVALSLMLLVGASLMLRTLATIQSNGLGANGDRILTLRTPFARDNDRDRGHIAFTAEVLRRMAAVPGVKAVAADDGLPPVFAGAAPVEVIGGPPPDDRPVLLHQTTHQLAEVLGIAVVQGRFLTEREVAGKQRAMVVNQTFVQRYAAGPGRMVRVRRGRELVGDPFQIVGVVKDRVNRLATNETLPEMYVPYSFRGQAERIYISTAIRPEGLIRAMSAQVYAADAAQPVMDTKTLEVLLRELVYARPRFNLILFLIFSGLGFMLALLGVYGVISHAVTQQRREIGIRIALGARLGQVVGMMLGMGARLLAIGIAAGLAGSLASIKLLNGLVRNVSTFDPWSFAAVSVLLLAAGLFASYWPARRAARIDPVTALRDE